MIDAKKPKDTLKESEERYRTLVELSPDLIGVHRKGEIIFMNAAGARLLGGRITGQFTGKHIREFLHPDYRQIVKERFEEARKRGVLAPAIEERFIKLDGTSIDVEVRAIPLTYEGEPAVLVAARDISEHKRVEQELRSLHERLRNLSAHLQFVREQERMAMAREIHDELGQTLTALKIEFSWLRNKLSDKAGVLNNKTRSMSKLIDNALETAKEICAKLRPGLLDDLGLVAAIEWQIQEFQKRTGIRCNFSSGIQDTIFDRDVSTAIFRILQEALTNVSRHAGATAVKVKLQCVGGKLLLCVRDNGIGIKESQVIAPKSFGLMGMLERAHSCDGEVQIYGGRKRGTTVIVYIPLKEKEVSAENSGR